jgi:hypothetical protein
MWLASDRTEKCTGFWWESKKERVLLEDKAEMGGWDQNEL